MIFWPTFAEVSRLRFECRAANSPIQLAPLSDWDSIADHPTIAFLVCFAPLFKKFMEETYDSDQRVATSGHLGHDRGHQQRRFYRSTRGTAHAKAPRATDQAPCFYRFNHGKIQATIVSDGPLRLGDPSAGFLGASREEIAKMLTDNFLSTHQLHARAECLGTKYR